MDPRRARAPRPRRRGRLHRRPRAYGLDERGREVLGFIPGEVAHYPLPAHAWTDAALTGVARLLRAYHDATLTFRPPEGAAWYFPPREPAEVICHGDIAPYNCVFRDGRPVAFIDFDTAHPGPRLRDVAAAAYRFAPLTAVGNGEPVRPVAEQARRLRLLADAYGLAEDDRAALPGAVREHLDGMVAFMHARAEAGDAAFARHIAEGHDRLYRTDSAHVARHAALLRDALCADSPGSGTR
ncbi:phosphotransferase [Thermocatellispora tengchongensis]|uniref:phosphotransferase n=1 Tax=Thermocatellispora tengchongensis TaxID=1073253 RepID=UPI00362AE05E